jgi:radical SAM superfamily enzyme YgiQ (UPF0313 family)
MRVVLADLQGVGGFVNKDRVAGGYGNRLRPFSRTTRILVSIKRWYADFPSVQMAYLAAICAMNGHQVVYTEKEPVDGDVALVLTSLVDYRNETAFADQMRARGVRVGFVGLAASKMPELFAEHGDFIIQGEPEEAVGRMARGEVLQGMCLSREIMDLDSLPFPRWDLLASARRLPFGLSARPRTGGFPLLASRSCPEHCTYCSHRILGSYRTRSIANIMDELAHLCAQVHRPYIIFRDPLFTDARERCLELCDAIEARGLRIRFECETRADRLDVELLRRLRQVGLRRLLFGIESVSPEILEKVGRRPTPPQHERDLIAECRRLRVASIGFFMLGFPSDTWQSVAATINYACELGPTVGSFKIVTPYPATPMWKQMEPLIVVKDWEQFDGFTPTFTHPNLTGKELRFLLGAAYSRFYFRPSYVTNLLKVRNPRIRDWVERLDARASARHARKETTLMSRPVTC